MDRGLLFHAQSLLLEWLALASFLGFAAMGVDKLLAVSRMRRMSEGTLWLAALVGGFVGVLTGGLVFHHKTSKAEFWAPVVVAAFLWVAAIASVPSWPGWLSS